MGSHVAEHLCTMGYKVIVLDDLSGGFQRNVDPRCIFVRGSITDEGLLDKLFEKYRFTYVYHLAAYAAEGLSHFIRRFNYENNLVGSVNLINRAVLFGAKHFIFTSSIAVYGKNQLPMVESLKPQPEDPYGISKYAVELDLASAHEMWGLNYTIFRPHNVYGERQNHGDPYRNVLGIFINNILNGKPMTVFGDGLQTRAFTYVGDITPVIARAFEFDSAKNQVFNIGADKPYTILDLAKTIASHMGVSENIDYLPARKEVVHAYADHSKARRIFDLQSNTTLDEGIRRMVEWSRKIGPLFGSRFDGIEVDKNLPPSWRNIVEN